LSPADRAVVDWRISEYEVVDDNEAGHVDKPVVLFSEFYTFIVIIIIIIIRIF